MTDAGFHPSDGYSRAAALKTDADELTSDFERANANADVWFRAGGLEIAAAVAIARCRWLERQLAAQEAAVKARLFEPTGNVVRLPRKKDDK